MYNKVRKLQQGKLLAGIIIGIILTLVYYIKQVRKDDTIYKYFLKVIEKKQNYSQEEKVLEISTQQ